jgi:hypothetical protein
MTDMNAQYFDQCYWHADGTLNCSKHKFTYDPNGYKKYTEFDTFSKPNENYHPNAYRKNINYYSEPYKYNSGVNRQVQENKYSIDNKWLAPPQTLTRVDYFKSPDSPFNNQWSEF